MEEELLALLSGAVSFPVAWSTLGAGTALPRAVMYRVSGVREMNVDSLGPMEGRVQIDCYGETYAEAIGASRNIRTTLEGYAGGSIMGAMLDSVRDSFDNDADLVHRVSLTFTLVWRE